MDQMPSQPIDVWNVETFDQELASELRGSAELVLNYFVTDKANYLLRENSNHRGLIRKMRTQVNFNILSKATSCRQWRRELFAHGITRG
jgi:hypothetical protein